MRMSRRIGRTVEWFWQEIYERPDTSGPSMRHKGEELGDTEEGEGKSNDEDVGDRR